MKPTSVPDRSLAHGAWQTVNHPHSFDESAFMASHVQAREVRLPPLDLPGTLSTPRDAASLVVFVHGSGSSRFSPRNLAVASALNDRGIATLLFDLLRSEEENDRSKVFNIPLLSDRLVDVLHWIERDPAVQTLPLGLFGASTGAAAALVAAARLGERVGAVVSRGGRPDLAGAALADVRAPVLLIVGGNDFGVIELNENALVRLDCPKLLYIVPGATHLFEEPGALEEVARQAGRWFQKYLGAPRPTPIT